MDSFVFVAGDLHSLVDQSAARMEGKRGLNICVINVELIPL